MDKDIFKRQYNDLKELDDLSVVKIKTVMQRGNDGKMYFHRCNGYLIGNNSFYSIIYDTDEHDIVDLLNGTEILDKIKSKEVEDILDKYGLRLEECEISITDYVNEIGSNELSHREKGWKIVK